MTKYRGGDAVKAGFYWNRGTWGVELVPAEGGALPGTDATRYVRVPWPLLLVIAPAMGGAFAMFLPFIGIALLVQFAWAAVTGRRVSRHAEEQI
jgi:hypothetical protein